MKQRTRKFLDGFLSGLGAPADVYVTKKHWRPRATSLESMRSDWEHVGTHLRNVIGRLNVEATFRDRTRD